MREEVNRCLCGKSQRFHEDAQTGVQGGETGAKPR